jgi:regulatory protein
MNNHKEAGVAPAPTEAALHEAALAHLARYGTTRAGLTRVLDRRVERWARAAGEADVADQTAEAKRLVRKVVARLVEAGVLSDAAFAEGRVRKLLRAGRSRRAVAAYLAARGVTGETAQAALPDEPEAELASALALAFRRRIGPFRAAPADLVAKRRELGVLARAGFPQSVAERALAMDPAEAEAIVRRLRQF